MLITRLLTIGQETFASGNSEHIPVAAAQPLVIFVDDSVVVGVLLGLAVTGLAIFILAGRVTRSCEVRFDEVAVVPSTPSSRVTTASVGTGGERSVASPTPTESVRETPTSVAVVPPPSPWPPRIGPSSLQRSGASIGRKPKVVSLQDSILSCIAGAKIQEQKNNNQHYSCHADSDYWRCEFHVYHHDLTIKQQNRQLFFWKTSKYIWYAPCGGVPSTTENPAAEASSLHPSRVR